MDFSSLTTECLSPLEPKQSIQFLEKLIKNPQLLNEMTEEDRIALLMAAGKLSRPSREEKLERQKKMREAKLHLANLKDRVARSKTGIRTARKTAVFQAPKKIELTSSSYLHSTETLKSPRNCYVCKNEFSRLHFFYESMCMPCAEFNYKKRFQTAPMHGKQVLITGARLKIGYQAALILLRSGANVIVTTRFPVDAASRFTLEEDFSRWKDKLQIYGLDLRHTPSVEIFCAYIQQKYPRLDVLINNAAQTVRRPTGFYAHMMEAENKKFSEHTSEVQHLLFNYQNFRSDLISHCPENVSKEKALPVSWHGQGPGIGIRASAQLSQIPYSFDNSLVAEEVFPQGKLDADLQQVDLRKTNSWRLKLGEIQTPEMLELQLVNAVAPFVLSNKLLPLMKKDFTGEKHIINVSAMEGKFHRFKKYDRHPHTNMAKAALNMLTHTSAGGLVKDGIFMNAVDTGWVTDEDPIELAKIKEEIHDFQPPLDIVDGAARVLDPLFDGLQTGAHIYGKFLKDYKPIDW